MSKQRIIIVGAGMAGLVASTYLQKNGKDVLLLEKSNRCGGLVCSFEKNGFLFDTGPRAFINSGILLPMLQELNLDLPFVKGPVSFGLEDQIVHFDDSLSLKSFLESLEKIFPDSKSDIRDIGKLIQHFCKNAEIMKKLPNPYFKNPLKDLPYLFTKFIPWLPSFFKVVMESLFHQQSVESSLTELTKNSSLRDMLSQHFFKGTPTSFALGYYETFHDYLYPLGGTGRLPNILEQSFISNGGKIRKNFEVVRVIPSFKLVVGAEGNALPYDKLLWTADLRSLYNRTDLTALPARTCHKIRDEKARYESTAVGESVFTLYLGVDEPPSFFGKISKGHFIYTPKRNGLGELHRSRLNTIKADFPKMDKDIIFVWLKEFCAFNSYEISIPALKDKSLAPEGKTGLVISILFDGQLTRMIDQSGWMDEFRKVTAEWMIDTLDKSIYPGFKTKIILLETASPLTLIRMFGNAEGAITG